MVKTLQKTHSWWENNVNRLGQYSGFAYDAMVSIALALNRSAEILASRNKTLDEFNYTDAEMAQIFKESLSTVKFQGFTVSHFICSKKEFSKTFFTKAKSDISINSFGDDYHTGPSVLQ